MKSLRKLVLPLLTAVLAVTAIPAVAKADNPITRPKWPMPRQTAWGSNTSGCDPNLQDADTRLNFGNCFNQNTLFVRLTGSPTGTHPNGSMMKFLEDIVETKLLRSSTNGSAPAATFATFLDLTLKRFLDADTATTIDYHPTTYLYRPVTSAVAPWTGPDSTIGLGGYEASPLFDRTCLDIPLVGSVCLHGYLWDVDNEVGNKFFDYNYNTALFELTPDVGGDVESGPWSNPTTGLCDASYPGTDPCGLSTNSQLAAPLRDDDDGLRVHLKLDNVKLDLFFEPPTDATLTDKKNDPDDPAYLPEEDLSTYVKAYGVAELGTVDLTIALRIAANYNNGVQPHSIGVGFELQDISFNSDFQFVFRKGPYCNNNLGTTETPAAGMTYTSNAALRPFNNAGVRNYAGLISDTTSNANPGPRALTYYALDAAPYPKVASTIAGAGTVANPYRGGGSGAGRDKIGVGTAPYEYNNAAERWSDNPNNCRRPADACDISASQATALGDVDWTQHGGPEWTGVTNTSSCEWPNVSNNSDDATYKISEQITSIIPYLQGELKVVAEDKFKNRTRPNPGYYLGPTSLLDLGSTLAGISFDWPLRPGTDYVFIDALLDSDVDDDDTTEFWADNWGVMMPFNFALGVSWNSVPAITAGTAYRLDQNACVQKLSVLTGYRDGFGEFNTGSQSNSDDPFLSKTYPNKGLKPVGARPNSYAGLLAGFGFPTVTTPGTKTTFGEVPAGAQAGTASYALGLALHQNVLSAALYDAVIKGLLCVDLDSSGQYAPVTDQVVDLSGILNTSTFQLFFPQLYDNFPDRPMRLRVVPLLKRYTHNAACGVGGCGNGIANFAVTSAVNQMPNLQPGAEAPYVIMGGPPIGVSQVLGAPGAVNEAFTSVDEFGNPTRYIYPDLSVVIPNLLLEFYVYGKSDTDNNWYRVFAIDLGVVIGLNIDVVQTPAQFSNLATVATASQATWYPIGCDPAAPSTSAAYCSGGYAYTKRTLRLAGLADPEINAIIEYSELTYGRANTQGTSSSTGFICGNSSTEFPTEPGDTSCTGTQRPVNDAFTNPAILKGAISNLIGLVLSVDVNALVEIGFDLGAFLNIPMAVDAPYIGPSYVVVNGGTDDSNATDREDNSISGAGNGFGDYLVAGVSLDLSKLSANYLIQQIDYLLDGTDSTKPFGIDGLDVGLAPNAKPMYDEFIPVPQATIQPPVKVSAEETVFRFAGYDQHDGDNVRYSWRVDNGVWSVFTPSNEARVTGLLEGKHTIEVKAINSKNMMQDVPARYTFVVDSIAPKIRVVGDRTVGKRANFFVEANDWLTPKEDVRVAYRLDDGKWTNFGYNKKISLSGLREGRHTLRVRAADNAGNTAETAFSFSASEGGFGCSTTSGAGSLGDILVMLVIPALVLLRKRLF